MTDLFGFSRQSWNNWKAQNRPIISLLEKYFTDLDINEFLKYGQISKFELIQDFENILRGSKLDYFEFISENLSPSLEYDPFTDFYYRFLVYINTLQNYEDQIDIGSIWEIRDAIPGFFIDNQYLLNNLDESYKYKFQYKVRKINNFDQNMSNFIRLNLSKEFKILLENEEHITFPEAYIQNSIIHALFYAVYKKYPETSYEEKTKILSKLFENDFNQLATDFDKYLASM